MNLAIANKSQCLSTITIRLTPELAEKLLTRNANNHRVLSKRNVARIVRDIVGDKWETTHQSIAFDLASNMIDGQHRCSAVSESGRAVVLRVTYYEGSAIAPLLEAARAPDPKVLRPGGPIDGQLKRTNAGTLASRHGGEAHMWRRIASHARALELVKVNAANLTAIAGPKTFDEDGNEDKRPTVAAALITEADIENIYADYKTEIDWACEHFSSKVSAAISFPIALWMPANEKKAKKLADYVRSGANIPAKHPALLLRKMVEKEKSASARETVCMFLAANSAAMAAIDGNPRNFVRSSVASLSRLASARAAMGLSS